MRLTVILFFILATVSYAQQDSIRTIDGMVPDSVCFSAEQVINIDREIRKMKLQLEYSAQIIQRYDMQLEEYERVIAIDSIMIYNLEQKNRLLEENIELLRKQLELQKPKWYENQFLNLGIGAILGGLIVAI